MADDEILDIDDVLDAGDLDREAIYDDADPHSGSVHQTHEAAILSDRLPEAEKWRNPSVLEAPDPRPGYVQRWVNVGYADESRHNISKRLREGWRLRTTDTVPDGYMYQTLTDPRFAGAIVVGDACLMEMSEQVFAQKRAHHRKLRELPLKAIDEKLRDFSETHGIRISNESTSVVTTGRE